MSIRNLSAGLCAVLMAGTAGYAPRVSSQASPPVEEAGARCSALAQRSGAALGEPTVKILSARLNPRSEAKVDPAAPPWMAGIPAMPAHCEVIGSMRERSGSDGQRYVVKFHLRLPIDWNGRFLFQGGGGTNGELGTAIGTVQPGIPSGLDRGFAVVSTDTGHDNTVNNNPARQGTVAFGHDYQARLEYAEKALDSVATVAKTIVQLHYGRAASHAYFAGCSNGGREGMVFAQRYPDQFDGIVAAAPAFAVPKAAIAEAWDTQAFAAVATEAGLQRNGLPDLARTFSDADLQLVADAVVKACDADDGLADGMVQRLTRCNAARVLPVLAARTCQAAKEPNCLSRTQVQALTRSLAGPHDSKGRALYAEWPWDAGIGSNGWRVWKIGVAGAMDSINVMLGSPALSGLFVTPPAEVASSPEANLRYQLGFDFDRDAPKIFGRNAEYPRSGWDLVGAQSTDLRRFRARGGKLLIPHGGSDPIFSINDTLAWWRRLDAANRGKATDFAKVFAVPGMTHCGGGPATDQFDSLGALVAWVETGAAPERIEARAGPGTPWPGRTRPLCAYPATARYRTGDINEAASFVCEPGR